MDGCRNALDSITEVTRAVYQKGLEANSFPRTQLEKLKI